MNFRQLRYFCEIVDAGSAAHAAERLYVAPTAISMQLAQLEQHLGGELFDRSRRPMELTSLGKFFYPRAKELLSQALRLDNEAQGIATGQRGWVGIGFVRSALFSILPNAIRTFRESFPDAHLDLVEVLSEYQPALLREGRIDIGISRFVEQADIFDDLDNSVILDEPFVAVLPINHPLAKQSSVSVVALAAEPFILYPKDPRSPFGVQMIAILETSGRRPEIVHEAIEIHTALALVGAGLGVTLVGKSIAENNRSDVAFVPLQGVESGTTLVAVTRRSEEHKLVMAFLDILTAQSI